MVPLELMGVRVEVPANTPMVLLREPEGRQRLLPILIGTAEATAIHAAVEGLEPPRPLTHDLMATLLDEFGVGLARIVITEVRDHTFYAELHLVEGTDPLDNLPSDVEADHVVSCRPSDAIALAVRCGAAIYAAEDLIEECGQDPEADPAEEAEEILDEFRDFIENVSPEDFKP
ncbi:MAG: bifunctional nuclease family protein [Actinomycetota bacterium]|nr:bifunctional nuclease family protein [Actinomycetota bacterium]